MTVVDVNTGKFTGSGGNLEETVTKNNLEAAEEVVRQLRLRDIGGIIVVDFIDMVLESNRDLVLRRLVECLGRDRTRHQVAEVTSLGLVQMTRKRIGTGLLEAFSENCDHCQGRGVVIHDQPVEQKGGDASGVRAASRTAASSAAAASRTAAAGSRTAPATTARVDADAVRAAVAVAARTPSPWPPSPPARPRPRTSPRWRARPPTPTTPPRCRPRLPPSSRRSPPRRSSSRWPPSRPPSRPSRARAEPEPGAGAGRPSLPPSRASPRS